MDIIFIKELELNALIGVYDFEKLKPQKLTLDVEIFFDTSQASDKDSLSLTIDYAKVAEFIINFAQTNHFELLETFINKLADKLLTEFNIPKIRLVVYKFILLNAKSTGVAITRVQN